MPKTKEKEVILENLEYIGLDIKNIPDFLMNYKDVEYKPTKVVEQAEFKVYKYISLKDIQILLTPINKDANIVDKYNKAHPLCEYLKIDDILDSDLFTEMLEKLDKKEIEKIEEEQELAKSNIPFRVESETSNQWEIYYSELTGKYFVLVSTDQTNFSALFYLLKKQIKCFENKKDELLFVPISHLDYTKRYLSATKISDIEKYIWLFTKEWPRVYEVFDKDNELTIHIVGDTKVYDEIKSYYKIELKTKNETEKFYDFIKALFILKAELPHYYDFDTQINEKGELIFELNNKIINYNSLSKFIKDEYKKNSEELQKIFEEKEKIDIELDELKEEELEKNKEYLFREKQVSTYLACRKSVFGKIKYFFKGKSGKLLKSKDKKSKAEEILEENEIQKSISNSIIEDKEIYTLEDLIKMCIELDRIKLKVETAIKDIKTLKDNIKVLTARIENAILFLETIDEHRKSIFEFWKFSNRDLPLGLSSGLEVKEEIKKIIEPKDMFVYICSTEKIDLSGIKTFYLNPTEAINMVQDEKTSLHKIKITLGEEILYNQTTIEVDLSEYKLDLKKQKIFRTNFEGDKFNFKERIVCAYEYDASLKHNCI